jgi:hypothetical protein
MNTEAFPIVPLYFEKVSEKSIYPISHKTRYDYNLTIMESPILARLTGLKNKSKATFEIKQ